MPALLIGSYFKRPKAPVELPNDDGTFTTYFFRPVDAGNPHSEHVATVTNAKHQQRLLAIAEGYYISEAQTTVEAAHAAAQVLAKPQATATPASTPNAEIVPPPPEELTHTAAEPSTTDPVGAIESNPAADSPGAKALLELPLKAFKEAVSSANPIVLSTALELECAKGEDERPTYVKALRAALKA